MTEHDFAADAAAERPALHNGHHVVSEVTDRVAMPIDRFDAWFQSVELEEILPGYGSIPRIVRSELVKGTWSDPGARRRVFMEDGSSVLEEVLEERRPHYFSYMVWGFASPIGLLARYGRGEFFMSEAGQDATDVRWVYSFAPKTVLAIPPLQLIVKTAFRPFMEHCMEAIRQVAEQWRRTGLLLE